MVVLILILLVVLAGGWWMLHSTRAKKEKSAWAFANEVANRIVLQHDVRFLDLHLSPKAQVFYPPSWRLRLIERIRESEAPQSEVRLTGNLFFTSRFFDPTGVFRAEIQFPTGPAYLDMKISHPQALWQIDALNWTWQPPPPPPPPTPSPTPTPTASPSAKPSASRRK